jgi:hypothetical protein
VDEFFDGSQENLIQFLQNSEEASTATAAENYEDSRIDTILL